MKKVNIQPIIKNKELYNTLLELSRTCLQYYYKHNVTKTSIFSQYYFPMSDHDKEIISFIDNSDCAKIFNNIPEIKKIDKKSIGTISQRQYLDNPKTCLLTFIKELSNQFPGGHLPQEGFDQAYEKLEEFIYEDFIEMGYVSRLNNFKLEGIEEIVFNDNLKVSYAPLTHSERIEAFSNSNPNISDYIIEAKVKFRKIVGDEGMDEKEGSRSFNYFYHVINAFKLLKPGSVSHDKIIVKPITFYPFGKGNMWYNFPNIS